MFRLIKRSASSLLYFVVLFFSIVSIASAEPTCDCEDASLYPTQEAVEQCISEGLCQGNDVPVNGNIWVLLLGGAALVALGFRKFSPAKD